jgi:hypothetical protein
MLGLFLSACREQNVATGTAATVNGEPITFRNLEARRSILFSGRSPRAAGFDDVTLQRQYRYVLKQMIEELVISQYMKSKGMALEAGQVEAEEKRIRDDYPPGAFEAMLLELAVDEGRWREGINRRLMMEQFITQVLRPEISITADEVQQYYRGHSADFVIPEQWHFMQIVGTDKREVEKAGNNLVLGKIATAAQKEYLVTIHDINMGADMLPKELLDDLSVLRPWQASQARTVDDAFRLFVLVEKTPSSMLDAAEMSKRVEQALADEKVRTVYAEWMQKRMRKADIRIAPTLTAPLPLESAPGRQ